MCCLLLVSALAWEDCPFGLVNDSYPGECGRYVDTNNNQICDHSELAPATAVANTPNQQTTVGGRQYFLLPISIILLLAYGASWMLAQKDVIDRVLHRRVWNVLLLLTFAASAGLGVLLALRISSGLVIPLPFDQLFWHVEAGIAMTAISVFHILWHWTYFACMLNPRRRNVCEEPVRIKGPRKK